MAQTWPVTWAKRVAIGAVDTVGLALYPLLKRIWRPRADTESPVRRILVIEIWLLGDVVLVTPLLQALRLRFPDAQISLLAKRHAEELLTNSGLVDQFITFDFPWTAVTGKYRAARYDRHAITALISRLRRENFDLTIDCRMDIRSNLIAFATGAPRRLGYRFGGGSYLLTDALTASPNDHHKVDDWLALLPSNNGTSRHIAGESHKLFTPRLHVTTEERAEAARRLRSLGFTDDDLIIGIHPGASQPQRRWSLADFAWVADSLAERHSAKPLVFLDPENYGETMPLHGSGQFLSTSLRELMATLTQCDLLICNDSGPMHIADALGVPVVAVFTTGNPTWHRPYGEDQVVVGRGTGQDCVSYPTRSEVLAAAELQLQRVRSSPLSVAMTPSGSSR